MKPAKYERISTKEQSTARQRLTKLEDKIREMGGIMGGALGSIGFGIAGGMIGSAFPIIGTGIGAIVGSLGGFFGGDWAGRQLAAFLFGKERELESSPTLGGSMDAAASASSVPIVEVAKKTGFSGKTASTLNGEQDSQTFVVDDNSGTFSISDIVPGEMLKTNQLIAARKSKELMLEMKADNAKQNKFNTYTSQDQRTSTQINNANYVNNMSARSNFWQEYYMHKNALGMHGGS